MRRLTRKTLSSAYAAATIGSVALLAGLPAIAHAETTIKMVLNWKYEGPQAWFFIAQDRGYFKAQGLDVQIDQGEGSSASIPKVAAGAYQAGFGDINAIVELAAKAPKEAPVAVSMLYNTPPYAIVVKTDSPIKSVQDLEGKTIGAPANDGALKLFPAFSAIAKIDADKVHITNMAPNLREQMLMRGQVDAVFGYVTTVTFSVKTMGLDPSKDIRFIRYGDHGMDLYSNALFFSQSFIKEHPEAVKGFLVAINHAIKDVIADPDAGIDAVMKREPLLNRAVEKAKLLATEHNDMSAPEIRKIGLGDVDPTRLQRDIDIIVQSGKLTNKPSANNVFTNRFLPPRADRPSTM